MERQFFEPLRQLQDLDSRFFLRAIKIEYKLQGFVGPQFLGVVPEAGTGIVVGGFHLDEPMHTPVVTTIGLYRPGR
jgi:hypothetical protein